MLPCRYILVEHVRCTHRAAIKIQCDRPECDGLCPEIDRRHLLCLFRYIWAYEACIHERSLGERNQRWAKFNADEERIMHEYGHNEDIMTDQLDNLQAFFSDSERRIAHIEASMKQEVRAAYGWANFYGHLAKGAQLNPDIPDVHYGVLGNALRHKAAEIFVFDDQVHTTLELLEIQQPAQVYIRFLQQRDEQEERDYLHRFRRRNLPPVPLFDEPRDSPANGHENGQASGQGKGHANEGGNGPAEEHAETANDHAKRSAEGHPQQTLNDPDMAMESIEEVDGEDDAAARSTSLFGSQTDQKTDKTSVTEDLTAHASASLSTPAGKLAESSLLPGDTASRSPGVGFVDNNEVAEGSLSQSAPDAPRPGHAELPSRSRSF